MISVIPFKSTYVRYKSITTPGLTPGRVYTILRWEEEADPYFGTHRFSIKDDDGSLRRMVIPRGDFEDYSFSKNLEEILE